VHKTPQVYGLAGFAIEASAGKSRLPARIMKLKIASSLLGKEFAAFG
jgi:hypothetical protein